MPKADKKRRAERKGRWAEYFAAFALILKGYQIKAMRFKTPQGEIDIIAKKGDLVILVEVKARKIELDAHHAISSQSARRIESAGDIWLSKQANFSELSLRKDLVAVLPWRWPKHIANAF